MHIQAGQCGNQIGTKVGPGARSAPVGGQWVSPVSENFALVLGAKLTLRTPGGEQTPESLPCLPLGRLGDPAQRVGYRSQQPAPGIRLEVGHQSQLRTPENALWGPDPESGPLVPKGAPSRAALVEWAQGPAVNPGGSATGLSAPTRDSDPGVASASKGSGSRLYRAGRRARGGEGGGWDVPGWRGLPELPV